MNFSFCIRKLAVAFYMINEIQPNIKFQNIVQCPFKKQSYVIWGKNRRFLEINPKTYRRGVVTTSTSFHDAVLKRLNSPGIKYQVLLYTPLFQYFKALVTRIRQLPYDVQGILIHLNGAQWTKFLKTTQ